MLFLVYGEEAFLFAVVFLALLQPQKQLRAPGWNVVGTLILEGAIKNSLKALFFVRASTCYRCPDKAKYNWVYGLLCLLTLCDQHKKEKWEKGMVCLFLC